MNSFFHGIVARAVAAVFVVAGPAFAADNAKKFAVGMGMEYATGDYGTDITTDSLRIPLTVDYFPTDRVSFELIAPYIYQDNSNTYISSGTRVPFERSGGMRRTAPSDPNDSVSGIGDVTLTARYLLQKESKTLPGLRPLLYLKLPTGDEDKALGTGEFDIGGGIGIFKWIGQWYTFVEGRYIFQGSNDALGLEDFGTLEGEIGYPLTRKFFPSFSLWWASSPVDDVSSLAEARLKGTYRIDKTTAINGYLGTGLTDTSADFGAGLALFFSF
ncbi:MAG: transporter [Desulfurivibrionaceae bacterium]